MKKSLFTLALMATVAACSAPAENAAEGAKNEDSMMAADATVASADAVLFADLGGEAENPIYTEELGQTLAVRGYDVVSYFVGDGTPQVGNEELTVRYNGYDYRFASEDNANAFVEEPAKYAPAYGGYCAWAIGDKNRLAPGDPEVFEIVDGKLYLNFNTDVQATWEKDIPGFIEKGDVNYPTHSADEHYKQQS